MDMRVSTVSPMVRCIIRGENNSVLLFCEPVPADEELGIRPYEFTHWELPKGKVQAGETSESAVQRMVYNKTGLFVETVTELVVKPTRFQNVRFIESHQYFVAKKTQGIFTRNEYAKGKEGSFQWIEYQYLSCYAVRKETMAMIRFVFEGYPT